MVGAPPSCNARRLVFTDLDGTLLTRRTYSAAAAQPALAALAARGIPVVFCSSKTAAEQLPLRRALGLERWPCIVENGSAVLVPAAAGLPTVGWLRRSAPDDDFVRVLGRPHGEVRTGLARAAAAAGIVVTGYADLSVAQVAALTGLDEPAANRARQREFSETLVDVLPERQWGALEAALAAEGLRSQHGGRFRSVTAADAGKGRAVRIVTDLFATAWGQETETVGLGDSANDADLLAAVDVPFLLAQEEGPWAPVDRPGLRRIARPGPEGWNEAVLGLLRV